MRLKLLSKLHYLWLAAMLATGLVLRAVNLQHPVLFIDEAESAINAMTILEHGVPTDEYLGLPIFENTLVQPWPDHPEYEFRDVSYSDRGLAIYHGWLPLYGIASSYWLAGIEPDVATDPPTVQTTREEMTRRTIAARMPSVVWGMAFLVLLYFAGRSMAGKDAALLAVTIAALTPQTVRIARQARYYAPTHALSLLCCWSIWLMARRGRWRDFVLAGVAFALLFHTHALTFTIGCVVWLAFLPAMLKHAQAWKKLAMAGGIIALAVVPWVVYTGFPGAATDVPAARALLAFPEDYLAYLIRHWKVSAAVVAGVAWLIGVYLLHPHLPARLVGPFVGPRRAVVLLLIWMIAGYVGFLLLAPASSAFLWRLTLGVQGPGILFVTILLAAGAQVVAYHWGGTLASIGIGGMLLATPAVRRPLQTPHWPDATYELTAWLGRQTFSPGTRIYATPTNHLTLTLLTGLPVQSIAPIRGDFLDAYPGEVVVLETVFRGRRFSATEVLEAAHQADREMTYEEAGAWAWRLTTRVLREELTARRAVLDEPLDPLPPFLVELVDSRRQPPREEPDGRWDNPAMFREHETFDKWGFWQTFFYRFVDPTARTGKHLNYAGRTRGARATVLDSTWVILQSPPPNQPALRSDSP